MNIKNFKFNTKISSALLAMEIVLCPLNSYAYSINNNDGMENNNNSNCAINEVKVAKITGNNVNVRSTPLKEDNIIGFCDKTDTFLILGYEDGWYNVNYLGYSAYIIDDYISEIMISTKNLNIQKMIYLKRDSNFYLDFGNNYITTLPMYQNAFVLSEKYGYYEVIVDGVKGYINKNDTKDITTNCAVVDLGRQIIKIYHGTREVYRAHIISGRKSMPSDIGYFKINHHLKDYQLTSDYIVSFWIEYNGDEGIHDASWQSRKNFNDVAKAAYEKYSMGNAKTYPIDYGSHGCINLTYKDAYNIFNLLKNGDHVLVIGPNDLIKKNLLSKNYIRILDVLNSKERFDMLGDNYCKIKKIV